jgi:hypothetical protein
MVAIFVYVWIFYQNHHKSWCCWHEVAYYLKILFRKIKKDHSLWQENGLRLCSVSVKQNEKPCIDGLLSVNQALCHLIIFP